MCLITSCVISAPAQGDDDSITVRSNVCWKYVACRGYHAYHNVLWFAEDQYLGKVVIVDQRRTEHLYDYLWTHDVVLSA